MESSARRSIEVAPLWDRAARSVTEDRPVLSGLLLSGRWPDDIVEWAQVLALAVRLAAVPGMLPATTVFLVREDPPADPEHAAVGIVLAEGPLIGEHAVAPGSISPPHPVGLAVLHPPSATVGSVRDREVASGCLFLPGLPHLGLDHRASWVESDRGGTVTRMVSRSDVDPWGDADTAALSTLLAA